MSFLKNLFRQKDKSSSLHSDFWNWFKENEKSFYRVVKEKRNVEKDFFRKLSPKLDEVKKGIFYLTGMLDDKICELVLTPDGNIKNIAFVEDLVNAAPAIDNWKFTALKPSLDIKDVNISMSGYEYNSSNQSFYSTEIPGCPDEIDVTIVHSEMTEENKSEMPHGTYIFLDNYLGELEFVTTIDNLKIIGRQEAQKELIPIAKLKDFLAWRQKEFIEKYQGIRYDTENDNYSGFEAELENGNMLVALINTDLLNWDCKASHPWISVLTIKYDGSKTNGMPGDNDYKLLNAVEEEIMTELKDFDGYLNIGRQTANSEREIYFACKDFRLPSKVFFAIQKKYTDKFEIEYDIYKDKYWQSFDRFNNQ